MANATINVVASVAGQTVPVQLSRSEDGTGLWTPSVTAGQTPTGWTKTDDTDGVAAMAGGHGLETGDRIDVFWNGGRHYNMTATVAGNNVTLAGGGGDALPASATAVVVAKHEVVDAAFDPDNMTVLLISTDRRASVVFVDAGNNVLLALDLPAGGCCLWWTNSGISRPMSGNPVAEIWVANGETAAAANVTVAVLYDSTPGE